MIPVHQMNPDPIDALSLRDLPGDVYGHIASSMRLPDFMNFMNTTPETSRYFRGKGSEEAWRRYLSSLCQKSIENRGYEEWSSECKTLVPLQYLDKDCPIQGLVRSIADVATKLIASSRNKRCDPSEFKTYTDANVSVRCVNKIEVYQRFIDIAQYAPMKLWRTLICKNPPLDPGEWLAIGILYDDSARTMYTSDAMDTAKAIRDMPGVPHSVWTHILKYAPMCIEQYKDAAPDLILEVLKMHPDQRTFVHFSMDYLQHLIQRFGLERLREVSLLFRLFGDDVVLVLERLSEFRWSNMMYLSELYPLIQKAREDAVQTAPIEPLAPDETQLLPCVGDLITVGKTLFTSAEMVRRFVVDVLANLHVRVLDAAPESERRHLARAITCLETWLEGRIDTLLDEDASFFNTNATFEDGATFDQIVGVVSDYISNRIEEWTLVLKYHIMRRTLNVQYPIETY